MEQRIQEYFPSSEILSSKGYGHIKTAYLDTVQLLASSNIVSNEDYGGALEWYILGYLEGEGYEYDVVRDRLGS